jgi:hypothetical protein
MIGLTITGNPTATLAVGASSSVIKGTYTITQADIDAGSRNTALATAKDPKKRNRCIRNGSRQQYSNHYPLTQNPVLRL